MPTEEYFSIKDFCAYIKSGKTKIWNGVKSGAFPAPIKIGGLTRWRRSEVDAWLDELAGERAPR